MADAEEDLNRFKRSLDKMYQAANEVLLSWEKLDHSLPPDIYNKINEHYPFGKDFYEVVMNLAGWVGEVRQLNLPHNVPWSEWEPPGE